jgi:anaerobic selenocysteine-containing dehydrogenase
MLARSARLVDAEALGAIELAPADAAARGIAAGDRVEVRSPYGAVEARAAIVPAMPAGRAFLAENAPGIATTRLLAYDDPAPPVTVTKR